MQAWDKFVDTQERELGHETVKKWLKSLKVLRFDACNIYLEAKDLFQARWFEEHIRPKVLSSLVNNNKRPIKIHLTIANAPAKSPQPQSKELRTAAPSSFNLTFDEIDPLCSFDQFICSEPNELTLKVFNQIAKVSPQNPQENPVYVHGGRGTGKTHLLMATANLLRQQGCHVVYCRADTFTDHVVGAIRAGEMAAFRQAYRSSDVLIIDDVHVFSRKGATQEEFFHTFNTLQVAGKQIILSANCAPCELQLIEPRLVSRFEWGIVLSLEQPSREDAAKILANKAQAMQFPLHPKVMEFLLESFVSTNALTKALKALILRSHLQKSQGKSIHSQLTVPIAAHLLADLLLEEKHSTLTPARIIRGVAEYYGIRPEDILGRAQTRECVLPRQISMHLCRNQLKMPFVKIGELFSKDHSTVMSSVKLIQKRIEVDDPEIAASYRVINNKLKTNEVVAESTS